MSYTIEHNIPTPKNRYSPKYPWNEMEVGDSFFVPIESTKPINVRGSVAGINRRRQDAKFFASSVRENGKPIGIRVWRIS